MIELDKVNPMQKPWYPTRSPKKGIPNTVQQHTQIRKYSLTCFATIYFRRLP
jgi:hypothetical protein